MTNPIPRESALLIAAGLTGLIDVEAGPTDEQRHVLRALAQSFLQLDAHTLASIEASTPAQLGAGLTDATTRRVFTQMSIILEMSRHPKSDAQLDKLNEYAAAVGAHGPQLDAVRSLAHKSAGEATADFLRVFDQSIPELTEPQFLQPSDDPEAQVAELCARVAAFKDLPPGTLGREFIDFYDRSGFSIPTPDSPQPGYYVCHDMNHVICGYEATGPAEIALGIFKLMMNNSDANWMASMVNLLIHEVGLFKHATDLQFVPYGGGGEPYHGLDGSRGALSMDGAPELVAEAFVRGAACTADFSEADHIAMAHVPLAEVRRRYNVTPLKNPMRPGVEWQ
jgi:hypothetical protein